MWVRMTMSGDDSRFGLIHVRATPPILACLDVRIALNSSQRNMYGRALL